MAITKASIRRVKFTPGEMADDGPSPAQRRSWPVVGRGPAAIFAKPAKPPTVTLAPDVAEVFGDSRAVNDALRGLIRLARQSTHRPRKTG